MHIIIRRKFIACRSARSICRHTIQRESSTEGRALIQTPAEPTVAGVAQSAAGIKPGLSPPHSRTLCSTQRYVLFSDLWPLSSLGVGPRGLGRCESVRGSFQRRVIQAECPNPLAVEAPCRAMFQSRIGAARIANASARSESTRHHHLAHLLSSCAAVSSSPATRRAHFASSCDTRRRAQVRSSIHHLGGVLVHGAHFNARH